MTLTFTLNEGSLQILIPSRWCVRCGQFLNTIYSKVVSTKYTEFFSITIAIFYLYVISEISIFLEFFWYWGIKITVYWSLEEISYPISNLFCLWKNYTPSESPPMSNMHPRVQVLIGPSVAYSRQANIWQSTDVPLMDHVCWTNDYIIPKVQYRCIIAKLPFHKKKFIGSPMMADH